MKSLILLGVLSMVVSYQVQGIDVSQWQGVINWNQVKASGIHYAIIRAGYGAGNVDPYFEQNYQGAHAAGVDVGAYWYSNANSVADGISEANYMLQHIRGKKFEYPIYYDIEENSIFQSGITNGIAKNFCSVMEANKFFCGFYCSTGFYPYFSDELKTRYSIWVAEWGPVCHYTGPYGMWQYYNQGRISGINTDVDMDYAYQDFPTIMKQAHLNGY